MDRILLLLFVLALTGVSALSQSGKLRTPVAAQKPPRQETQRGEKEVRDADLRFAKETGERRLDGWMDFFASDAVIIHNGQTIAGKQAIREFYEPVFANKDFVLTWTPTRAEVSSDATLAYTYGDYEAKSGGQVSHGMYVTLWHKENGQWKVAVDLGSARVN